jgi:CO/xanthine dehydrogenase FAD-binding subunit
MSYSYHRPKTLEQAWQLAQQQPGARFIAGGTDLLVKLREGRQPPPPALISLRNIDELRRIEVGEVVRLGALVTIGELVDDEALGAAYPVLSQAARRVGSVQIRNAATVGGNICNASPCADTAPPLLVAEARVELASPTGRREVPLEDFFVAPGQTRIADDEIVTALCFDRPAPGTRAVFYKKGRVAMDLSLVSVAVLLQLDGARCTRARVAAGSVAPRPVRLHRTEATVEGGPIDAERLRAARAVAAAEVEPITDLRTTADYRRHLVGVLVERAVTALCQGRLG